MLCSICIPTYRRPQLLGKLLNSLVNQRLPDNVTMEIIVVDNDSQGSAEEIFRKYSDNQSHVIHYFIQPEKNISLTRNMAISKARGNYIFFIDDDEFANPDWIANLLKTLQEYDADAVFGRVLSYFSVGTPEWLKRCVVYNRPAPPTGTEATGDSTANCLIKWSILNGIKGPFDPSYGITGGEDTQLFAKLRREGARFVHCREGWVSEYVPPERTRLYWLIKRVFRTGNGYTRIEIDLAGNNKTMCRFTHLAIATSFAITSVMLAFLTLFSKEWRLHWTLKAVSNVGKIFAVFGYFPKPYRTNKISAKPELPDIAVSARYS